MKSLGELLEAVLFLVNVLVVFALPPPPLLPPSIRLRPARVKNWPDLRLPQLESLLLRDIVMAAYSS